MKQSSNPAPEGQQTPNGVSSGINPRTARRGIVFRRALGIALILLGGYIGWCLLQTASSLFDRGFALSVVPIVLGALVAWRPGDIQ